MALAPSPLRAPLLVAVARDSYLTPRVPFPDKQHMPLIKAPMYGQDITSGYGRKAPGGQQVGSTPSELKPKMRKLLSIFARRDTTGMATRLFDAFLRDTCRPPLYFDDASLNAAADAHPNIQFFCSAVLSAPNSPHRTTGHLRLHQALKASNWDISKIAMPQNLGVPAFNLGSKVWESGDFANGLGLMINGVQHVYVIATHYTHDQKSGKYAIRLKYLLYDVFGLDDDDLREYGAASPSWITSDAAVGITAWWQLQHQFGYAPYVTRIVLEKSFEAPAI